MPRSSGSRRSGSPPRCASRPRPSARPRTRRWRTTRSSSRSSSRCCSWIARRAQPSCRCSTRPTSRSRPCGRSSTRSNDSRRSRPPHSSPSCRARRRVTCSPRSWSMTRRCRTRARASSSSSGACGSSSDDGGFARSAGRSPRPSRRKACTPRSRMTCSPCSRTAPASTSIRGAARRSSTGPSASRHRRDPRVRKEFKRMSEEPKLEELDRLISMGKQKGFLTYDEVNDALPSDIVSLDQLDDIMMMFGAMDIEVVDSAKAGRLPSEVGRERQPQQADDDDDGPAEPIDLTPGPVGRTEDPVRLYLREMGRVSLLTREGEITLAKRIEEGKDESTRAILSTTLALDKIRAVRDDLRKDLVPIKDLVDYPEEELTEEKEADLRRSVMRELGTDDRLSRQRENLLDLARKLRAKAGGRKTRRGEPPWKKHEVSAQAKQVKALQTLRTLSLQPSLLDQWGQDLKKLVEKIQVAEREIALWSDGKRPAPAEVDAFLDSLSEDREDGDRDLYQKAAARHPSIKERREGLA